MYKAGKSENSRLKTPICVIIHLNTFNEANCRQDITIQISFAWRDTQMEIKYQVFVSSTYEDLKDERKEASQAILESHCIPAGMELFPASNKAQWDVIKKVIDDSDFYLLIIAGKYGSMGKDDTGKSVGYTEMEFDYAVSTNKPILAFVHEDIDSLPRNKTESVSKKARYLESFRKKVCSGRIIKKWSTKDNLKSAILVTLSELKSTTDAYGWIRADFKIEQQSFSFFEQQRTQFEMKIKQLEESLNGSIAEIKEKSEEIGSLNDTIDCLVSQLSKAAEENLQLSQKLFRNINFWSCLLQINTAYKYISDTSERLLADIRKEWSLNDPESWFLKWHDSRHLWESVLDMADSLLSKYENAPFEQKDVYISHLNSIYSKYSSESFDSYVMEDEEIVELVGALFFLLKLCERYRFSNQFDFLASKTSGFITLCDALIDSAWEAELALRENDC